MQKTSSKKSAAMKLGLAAVASVALTFGAAMPAFAADVQIGPDAVAPYEVGGVGTEPGFNYDQWHVGSERANTRTTLEGSLEFGECEVTMGVPSKGAPSWVQVMKGFPVDVRPTSTAGGSIAAVAAVINSTSFVVETGSASIQIPVFIFDEMEPDAAPDFTTFRSAVVGPGTYNLADLEFTDEDSSDFYGALAVGEIFELIESELADDYTWQILGVGFNGNEGASVKSLSFSGNTYHFGTGSCLPAGVTPPKKVETAA